jgi:predicted nucleotidyltransferase
LSRAAILLVAAPGFIPTPCGPGSEVGCSKTPLDRGKFMARTINKCGISRKQGRARELVIRSIYTLGITMAKHEAGLSLAMRVAQDVAGRLAAIPEVEAVVLAGSRTSPFADEQSDLDLYVYASEIVPVERRAEVARGARQAELGNAFWESGDEWIHDESGTAVDVMFRTTSWIEEQLDRVLRRHEASIGYSTCFWYNVRNSRVLSDRNGWFAAIQKRANQPYPKELKQAIVAKNYPILRTKLSSYRHQIERALERQDAVSVNHRAAALLASYFDIVFAVNEQPHPGEKRLVRFAHALCKKVPTGMTERVHGLLSAVSNGDVVDRVNKLLDGLDDLLRSEGLL